MTKKIKQEEINKVPEYQSIDIGLDHFEVQYKWLIFNLTKKFYSRKAALKFAKNNKGKFLEIRKEVTI